ncbi:MAG: hypothetical protein K2Q03_01130 [Sphingobacteriaceae bacterium]|nr:hypothetical protein [Sphingobacteriaceae bacterium]
MRNRVIAFFLIFGILSVNMTEVMEYVGYKINQKYIVEKFCVNKAKPQLRCEGKCYLANKIKKAIEKEQKQQEESLKSQLQIIVPNTNFSFNFYSLEEIYKPVPICIGSAQTSKFGIFHPPKANC